MKVRTIKANAILNVIYTVSNIVFPIITFPYISRILLVEEMGKISFFTSVSNYAVMIGSIGISMYGIREVAKVRENKKELSKVTMELLTINTMVTLFVLILLSISTLFVKKFCEEPYLFIISFVTIFFAPLGLNWLYAGLEQYEYITKRTIIFKIMSLILVLCFVRSPNDYIIFSIITTFSIVGTYICNFTYAKKNIKFNILMGMNLKKHIKPMLILFSSVLSVSVYTNLDTIMLGFISGDREVGLYTVAVKSKVLLLTVINAISTVLLPRFSFYLEHKQFDEYYRILKKSISIIFFISIPLSIYFIVEARDSILLLGGLYYEEAIFCMQILMPILLISGCSNIIGNQILIPQGKDTAFLTAVCFGAIIDIFFNILLMPKYGCIGAATATLLAEISQMVIQVRFAKETILKSIRLETIMKSGISACIACVITVQIRQMININPFINLIVTAIIYFCIYGGLLVILKVEEVREIIHK